MYKLYVFIVYTHICTHCVCIGFVSGLMYLSKSDIKKRVRYLMKQSGCGCLVSKREIVKSHDTRSANCSSTSIVEIPDADISEISSTII